MIALNNESHGKQIAKAYDGTFYPGLDAVISRVTPEGKLLGGVIYSQYTGASITMHTAGFDPRWVDRDMLWVAFDYPFNQLGCRKVFGQVKVTNTKALEFDTKLGFKWEAVIKDVYPEDMIVLSMYREQCRWLALKPRKIRRNVDGQEQRAAGT